jgi:hypothetical protein
MKICVDIYLSPYDFFNPRHPVFPLQAYYQGMHPTVLCNQNSHPINNKKMGWLFVWIGKNFYCYND